MFDKGDYVNYSTRGICQIEDICFMSFGKNSKGHNYYILKPISQEGESIFVPTDNEKLIDKMKPVLTPVSYTHLSNTRRRDYSPYCGG